MAAELTALLPALAVAFAAGAVVGGLLVRRTVRARTARPPGTPSSGQPDSEFDRLLDALEVGIVTIDRTGYVTRLNAAAATIFDVVTRPVRGRAMIELVPSYDLDQRVRDALAGRASRGPIELTNARGSRSLAVATLPFGDDGGAIVIASDESEKTELERTRREFVSNVSHELRTPLSAIKLMVETLLDAPAEAERRALFLPQIKGEVDRMVALVEDLLDLARAERGRLRLRREPLDLGAVATATLRPFAPRAERAQIALVEQLEGVRIDGDADRLAQVIVNLVDNALRHTHSGGNVEVRLTRDGDRARLSVSDSGEGIPYNDVPHIFERFYVVERSRTREAAGTGLGLSIVKQVVEAHGGAVAVDSELGVGSTFSCWFPLANS
ncbi:MAG: sensor histidine kinase [Vulcanimicrobiaceae bacterium]